MKKTIRILRILIIILSIFLIYCIGVAIYAKSSHKLDYKAASYVYIPYVYIDKEYDKEQIRSEIEKLTNVKFYFYKEKELVKSEYRWGRSNLITRVMTLHNDLSYYNYIFTFTHECMHLKYMTCSERFVEFETFKVLYSSGNEDFKNAAIYYDYNFNDDYNCWYYIKGYLGV
mgnify:CR=1 FL=1